jgi:hypothetical protein
MIEIQTAEMIRFLSLGFRIGFATGFSLAILAILFGQFKHRRGK